LVYFSPFLFQARQGLFRAVGRTDGSGEPSYSRQADSTSDRLDQACPGAVGRSITMNPRGTLFVLVAVFSTSEARAGVLSPWCQITVGGSNGSGYLAVVGGKLTVMDKPPPTEEGERSGAWYVQGTRIKSTTGHGYLAYDLSGKDRRVFLVPLPGQNTEWRVDDSPRPPSSIPDEIKGTFARKLYSENNPDGWTSHFYVSKGKFAGQSLGVDESKQPAITKRGWATAWRPLHHP